ncbi:MAG: ComEC/Rec2 family competence protein, partial [Thermoguttaceae bacterium]
GPQLSFLCVAGLMYFAPRWMHSSAEIDPLSRLIAENRGWMAKLLWLAGQSMRHFTLVSATMWLLTLPLVMARFHLCTPIAILLNTLIWLPMAAAVVSGLLTLLLGACCPPLACASAVVCNGSLWLLEWLVGVSRHVPLGHNWVPGPDDWWLAGFYGVLGLWLAFPRCRPPRRWRVALLAAWITAGLVGSWRLADPAHLRCTFLSVGHGGAAVVELPSRQVLLYDAGEFGAPSGAARTIAGFLWTRGITHIDAIVLSHADVDHYNAVPGLLDRFSVGAIYVSPVMFEDKNQAVSALLRAIRQSKTPIRVLSCGDRLCGGAQCRLKVLHPPDPGVLGTDNANSLVLLVEHLGHRILLTGDLEPPGLDDVLAEEPLDCDILAVPHHGSRRSDPVRLAAWSRPRWAVVSASRRWNLAPVEAIYRAAGAQVLETPDTGAITALLGAEGARVRCFFPFLAPCRAGGIAKQFKDSKL